MQWQISFFMHGFIGLSTIQRSHKKAYLLLLFFLKQVNLCGYFHFEERKKKNSHTSKDPRQRTEGLNSSPALTRGRSFIGRAYGSSQIDTTSTNCLRPNNSVDMLSGVLLACSINLAEWTGMRNYV